MIQVESLTKLYGSHVAIQDVSFKAKKGEILGLLGPNGAGKTTTMRILTAYMPPTEGSASIAGFDVVAQSLDVRRRVGYMPETVPLYPEMSVVEYLAYMGALRRVEDIDERIETVVEEVGLVERSQSFIGNLSKGLRQRVGLAQALLHEPDVLILDEPTIGLDPAQIIEVRKLIQELGRKRTVVLSTHILPEAQQVCDRVLILNKGRIVAKGTPADLQKQLEGVDRFVVQAGCKSSKLLKLFKDIPGVSEVQKGLQEGMIEVSSEGGQDLRPLFARRVVEAGIDLLEIRSTGLDLEKIFVKLTKDDIQTGEEQ
ncbi:MAG TPA: ABC transporter ATP-binding protein [Anaerolineae bacterium]|nr:ABC transporter ATP-binding protein [Anaerolineae bacterium]